MSLKATLARVLVLGILETAALCGIPMTPRQIEEILQTMTRTRHEHVLRDVRDDGDGHPPLPTSD